MGKGSAYERKICKQLGLWFTDGARDDIFWRSCQSGGRATQRAKSGKTTFGSYGDIAAVDPIGGKLIKLFTIELKRGRSHGCPTDLLDAAKTKCVRPFEATLNQAILSTVQAGSKYWMLICQRDRKVSMLYTDVDCHVALLNRIHSSPFSRPPSMRFDILVNQEKGGPMRMKFVGMPLDSFLLRISPKQLLTLL